MDSEFLKRVKRLDERMEEIKVDHKRGYRMGTINGICPSWKIADSGMSKCRDCNKTIVKDDMVFFFPTNKKVFCKPCGHKIELPVVGKDSAVRKIKMAAIMERHREIAGCDDLYRRVQIPIKNELRETIEGIVGQVLKQRDRIPNSLKNDR